MITNIHIPNSVYEDEKKNNKYEEKRPKNDERKSSYKRTNIPKALREQVWIKFNGINFKHKCFVSWCSNTITVFNYECGHNIPLTKGGDTTIENLRPICSNCNKSMSNTYTIDQWNLLKGKKVNLFSCCGLNFF